MKMSLGSPISFAELLPDVFSLKDTEIFQKPGKCTFNIWSPIFHLQINIFPFIFHNLLRVNFSGQGFQKGKISWKQKENYWTIFRNQAKKDQLNNPLKVPKLLFTKNMLFQKYFSIEMAFLLSMVNIAFSILLISSKVWQSIIFLNFFKS